jgi:hypothetical protein
VRNLQRPGVLRAGMSYFASVWDDADHNREAARRGKLAVPTLYVGGAKGVGTYGTTSTRQLATNVTEVILPGSATAGGRAAGRVRGGHAALLRRLTRRAGASAGADGTGWRASQTPGSWTGSAAMQPGPRTRHRSASAGHSATCRRRRTTDEYRLGLRFESRVLRRPLPAVHAMRRSARAHRRTAARRSPIRRPSMRVRRRGRRRVGTHGAGPRPARAISGAPPTPCRAPGRRSQSATRLPSGSRNAVIAVPIPSTSRLSPQQRHAQALEVRVGRRLVVDPRTRGSGAPGSGGSRAAGAAARRGAGPGRGSGRCSRRRAR